MSEPDPRIVEAKALPIGEIADRLGLTLKPAGRERVGPCPTCGGTDRFAINLDLNLYNCRSCGGGDVIRLVEMVENLDFLPAVTWMVGEKPADPAEAARRRRRAAEADRKREARAAKERAKSIKLAREIWREGEPVEGSPVRDYLSYRAIEAAWVPDLPTVLRYHPALRYTVQKDGVWQVIHQGPAMLAAVTDQAGHIIGVHRTWIDLANPGGKASIAFEGKDQPAKKMLGSKKGGAIRLARPREKTAVLVVGEGIETTLSALVSDAFPQAAFWCAVDLGNMAGRRLPTRNPKTGKTSTRYSETPDLEDQDAFVPPPWIKRLIFIQDGDSAPRETRAKLISGLMRAHHHVPGLTIQIAHAGDGVDLNDVLKDGEQNE